MEIKEFIAALNNNKDVIARFDNISVLFHGTDVTGKVKVYFYMKSSAIDLLLDLNNRDASWKIVERLTQKEIETTDL